MRAECGLEVSMPRAAWVLLILSPSMVYIRKPGRSTPGGATPPVSRAVSAGHQMVGQALLDPADERAHLLRCVDQRGTGRIGGLPHRDTAVRKQFRLHALSSVGTAPRALPAVVAE